MKHHNTTGSATLTCHLRSKLSVGALATICLCSKCAAVLQQPSLGTRPTKISPSQCMHNSRPETSKCTHIYPYTDQQHHSAGHCHQICLAGTQLCHSYCGTMAAAALQCCSPDSSCHAISSCIHTRRASHALLLYIKRTPGPWHSTQTQLLHMQ
jgi:hypothetical protein